MMAGYYMYPAPSLYRISDPYSRSVCIDPTYAYYNRAPIGAFLDPKELAILLRREWRAFIMRALGTKTPPVADAGPARMGPAVQGGPGVPIEADRARLANLDIISNVLLAGGDEYEGDRPDSSGRPAGRRN